VPIGRFGSARDVFEVKASFGLADFRDDCLQCNQGPRISATVDCSATKLRGFPRRLFAPSASLADFRDDCLQCWQASRISATTGCSANKARGFPRRLVAVQTRPADFRDGFSQ
jgi:hypothetical protein